mmetsp:Transcript_17999/g.32211  ORF Transcript_17999/g.32211 Transcript_17999/m.32211 type:complete len:210 (-) Transcript_17999:371-1000(-)
MRRMLDRLLEILENAALFDVQIQHPRSRVLHVQVLLRDYVRYVHHVAGSADVPGGRFGRKTRELYGNFRRPHRPVGSRDRLQSSRLYKLGAHRDGVQGRHGSVQRTGKQRVRLAVLFGFHVFRAVVHPERCVHTSGERNWVLVSHHRPVHRTGAVQRNHLLFEPHAATLARLLLVLIVRVIRRVVYRRLRDHSADHWIGLGGICLNLVE